MWHASRRDYRQFRRHAKPHWAPWCITSAMLKAKTFSRPTLRLISCRNSMKPRDGVYETKNCATKWFVKRHWKVWHRGSKRLVRQACGVLRTVMKRLSAIDCAFAASPGHV